MSEVHIQLPFVEAERLAHQFNLAARKSGDEKVIAGVSEETDLDLRVKNWHDRAASQYELNSPTRFEVDRLYKELSGAGRLLRAGRANEWRRVLNNATSSMKDMMKDTKDRSEFVVHIHYLKYNERFYVSMRREVFDVTDPIYEICWRSVSGAIQCTDSISMPSDDKSLFVGNGTL